jgi:hypothetical protein
MRCPSYSFMKGPNYIRQTAHGKTKHMHMYMPIRIIMVFIAVRPMRPSSFESEWCYHSILSKCCQQRELFFLCCNLQSEFPK